MGTTLALLTIIVLALISLAFWRKVSLQFEYLHRKTFKKAPGSNNWIKKIDDPKIKEVRNQALLIFPLLFGVNREDEGEDLNQLKNRIRSIHLMIYLLLMAVVLLGLIGKGPAE